jgi:hypothetical protein
MYTVVVFDALNGEAVTSRDFAFGTWAEIGFWLDHYGYNDDRFYLNINFS